MYVVPTMRMHILCILCICLYYGIWKLTIWVQKVQKRESMITVDAVFNMFAAARIFVGMKRET